jgi:4-hydroxy-tetrahydrodipicolinate synthase
MNQSIHGVLAPVVTPFKADLSPDRDRFIRHCQWLLSQNCGLAPFGTTSEGNSMSTGERISLLDALVAAGIDPSRMIPGTGCCSISETVELTGHAVKNGCAGVLMLPPFYYKDISEEGLYRYFNEVVQRVGDARLKIYLYHIPPVAIVGITPRLVERLLKAYPNAIAGMKDSSGDWNNTKTFLDAFSETARPVADSPWRARTGFDVFVGSETFLLANMRSGGTGTISATANVNPAGIHELYAECTGSQTLDIGDRTSKKPRSQTPDVGHRTSEQEFRHRTSDIRHPTQALQARLNVVRDVFSSRKFPSMIAALKQAIAIYANDPEWARVRPPLIELTTAQAELLAAELKRIEFVMNGI